jgi:hypothetical protein
VWTADTAGTHIAVSPTVADGLVYVGTGNGVGELDAFAAAGCGSSSCSPLFTYALPAGVGVTSPAVIANGSVYFATDSPTAGLNSLRLSTAGALAVTATGPRRGRAARSLGGQPGAAQSTRRIAGTGPASLGDISVKRPATLQWTTQTTGGRLSFKLGDQQRPIAARIARQRGQSTVPPNTYRDVRLITRGRWTIQIK